ncbi:pilus assembly protein N-terminal domain-containing protein [Sinorhizobium sojae]|uniref:pilus assembly protein N-terminal domain-containing protein n=1 Tax=Sinorhizobium sojae TaxID=716925 RepID=UPI0005569C92|nr:pilus assembly protein N-terminal domain-containing protein [Sinorhizobium sojae]
MRISVKWPVLTMAVLTAIGAAHAQEDPPGAATAQGPVRQTDGVIKVVVDFARPLFLDRPARTVIIGNPAIAQATLSDDRTVVLTGKAPGSTNLIVMDSEGTEVANLVLEVVAAGGRLITVHEGNGQATYSCTERCDRVPGDVIPAPPAELPQTIEGGDMSGVDEP